MRAVWTILIYYSLTVSCGAPAAKSRGIDPTCEGGQVVLRVTNKSQGNTSYTGFPGGFGKSFNFSAPAAIPLVVADPLDACQQLPKVEKYAGAAVLVSRGSCSFTDKVVNLQAANALIAVVFNNEAGCFLMGSNLSSTESGGISVASVSVSQDVGQAMIAAAAKGAQLAAWQLRPTSDPGDALMWLMAVATVVLAGHWAASDYLQQVKGSARDAFEAGGRAKAGARGGPLEVVEVTAAGAVTFVLMASAMLLLLFFFLNRVFAIILVGLFCLASTQAMVAAGTPLLLRAAPSLRSRQVSLSVLGTMPLTVVLLAPCAAAIAITWALLRDASSAWVLADMMGISLIVLLLRQLRLPNIQVACVLLPLSFAYDVFWVFLQPLLLGGPSVMVEVATGGSSHERLPMLLQVPHLLGPGYSMLGYGDVVLPGLLVVFMRIFDLQQQRSGWQAYFYATCIGYGVGLLITYGALLLNIGGQQGQPALLYLIPCTLGLVLLLGWQRGDLAALWGGEESAWALKGERLPIIREDDLEQGDVSDTGSTGSSDMTRSLLNRCQPGSM